MTYRMGDIFNNNLLFEGIKVMFVIDILKSKLVKRRLIFEVSKESSHTCHSEENSIWHNLDSMTLKHNYHQEIGSKWEAIEEDYDLLRNICITNLNKKFSS